MVDLHTHTNHSDGSQTTVELLAEAEEKGIKYLSITDHDTLKAYEDVDAVNLKDYYTGELITGMEITTTCNGELAEVLAYNFDCDILRKKIEEHNLYISYEERYKRRFPILKREYTERGIHFDFNVYYNTGNINHLTIYKEIVRHDQNDKFFLDINNKNAYNLFFRRELYNPESEFYIDQTELYPKLETVLKIIRESRGLAFLAHPYIYTNNIVGDLENILTNYPFDGIECFHTAITKEQSEYLLKIAEKFDIYVSGGS
ncbi:MAG: PHP domain-containing protein, partial [Clostridiales bacterium]|nr:PHP domain-containing protein [Clostridiales bacterium]